jgi:hypothetical protein
MGVDLEEDLKRKMIELNMTAARNAQSPQTGYIHFNYELEKSQDTIPLLENFCFCLALLRSRIAEHVLEGKTLLEKLLCFEVDGNFPIYLHEFPQCKDRAFSLSLLPVFHWILKDFRTALGEPLAKRIEMLIHRIISHGYKMHTERPLSKSAEFRLKSYFEPHAIPLWTPSTPEEWAEALISYQMTPLNSLLENALQKWHPQLCVFIGPQHHERKEPKVTLFDLFMGHYHDVYSQRALEDRRVHLMASLIQPFEEQKMNSMLLEPICHVAKPFALYWGSASQLHSLMLEAQKAECSVEKKDNVFEFTIALPSRTFQEGEEAFEVAFFMNLQPSQQIQINGANATTFQLGDTIDLLLDGLHVKLELTVTQGEGRFFGHISRANRPTQKAKNLKFETFDWQIALRTICRSEQCLLKAKLSV